MTRHSTHIWIAGYITIAIAGFLLGVLVFRHTKTIDSSTTPTIATVELAPNRMAYCPNDPTTPHPVPCLNKP